MPITLNGDTGIQTPMYNGTITANAVTPSVNMKNRIINGNMSIDQRNAGASLSIPDATVTYTLDRWNAYESTSGTITVQQSSTAPAGFVNSLLATVTSASTATASQLCRLQQRIEGYNIADLGYGTANAKTITVSFWVRSSLIGTYCASIRNSNATRSYVATYTISVANTWEYKTITIAGDTTGTWLTTNGTGFYLDWDLGSGSDANTTASSWVAADKENTSAQANWIGTASATFFLTGVQLEVGSTATSFDYRPYGTELTLCQRYFQLCDSMTGVASSTTQLSVILTYLVTARTTSPTITQTDAIRFTDAIATNPQQSALGIGLNNAGRNEAYIYLNNYSGLTQGKFYLVNLNNTGAVGVSTEL